MDKISTQSYLEIIGLLTSAQNNTNIDTIKDLFCFNISKVYECLKSNVKYMELLEYINEKFPYLSSSPKLLVKITNEELVKLFVEWNLFLLEMYSLSLTKEMRIYNRNLKKNVQNLKSPELLNSNEKKSLWYSIDFVFALGISNNMHPGVGLPVSMKSKGCQNVQKYFASTSIPFDDSNQIIPENKESFELFQKSLNLMMELFQLKLSPLFKEHIISYHFNTYITALFQISFSKMAPPANKVILIAKSTSPVISSSTTAAVENIEYDMTSTTTTPFIVDVSRYKEYLDDVIMTSPLKFIFRNLLFLVGETLPESKMEKPSHPKIPKWLIRRCSAYIRDCIVKDNGIQSIILSLIDECCNVQAKVTVGRPVNVDWNRCNSVAHIVMNCPLGSYSSEKYHGIIAEQIIDLIKKQYYSNDSLVMTNQSDNRSRLQQLSNNDNININITDHDINKGSNCYGDNGKVGLDGAKFSNETSRAMMPCIVRIMENLLQKEPKIFYELILNVIIDPLISCMEGNSKNIDDKKCKEIVSERNMSICIETLHELMVIFHFPGSTLARCLLPYLNILFQLYLYASGGVSFLRSTIESLVQHVFNQLESHEISKHFYAITNLNVHIPTKTSDDMPVYKTTSKPSSTLSPSSLTPNSDDKLGLGENRDVTNCIYRMDPLVRFVPGPTGGIQIVRISLRQQDPDEAIINLEEIETKSICISKLIIDSDNKELAVQVFLTCLKELTEIVADEFKTDTDFIKIFSSKFSNFNLEKISHNILLLALLGILVDKLDHLCLKNAGQIFFFAQVTMERSIKFMQHTNPNVVLEVANFQEETLALVIGLLATILLGPNQVTREEWTKAGGLLPSLRYLSDHHESSDVRLSSHELMKTIMMRGKLLDGNESSGKLGKGGFESLKNDVKSSFTSFTSMHENVKRPDRKNAASPIKRVQFVDQSCSNSLSGANFNVAASSSAASMSSSSSSSSSPPSPSLSFSSSSSSFPSHNSLTNSSMNQSVSLPLLPDNDLLKPVKTTMVTKDTKIKSALITPEAKNEKSSADLPPLSSSCSSKTPKTVHFSKSVNHGNENDGNPMEKMMIEEISEENLSLNNELQYHSEIKSLLETLKSSNRSNNSSLGKSPDSKNTNNAIGDCSKNKDDDDLALFQQMLVDLNDFMIPVISHGLLTMRKLIEKRSPSVEKYKNFLLKICRYHVKHEDSYVYLNAIYALSALTSIYHEQFLQILMDDYVDVDRDVGSVDYLKVDENQMRFIDVKLKLGEALLRVVTKLGSTAIAYKNKLFSTLVKVSRNDYPTVRSSAITNLAQLCELLGFSLSSNVNEIFNSLKCMLKYDKSIEVRRAAALATHQILKGTSRDTLRILGDVLAEFYRLLKDVHHIEKDDVVKIHIHHSIEELNASMKNFLFPTSALEKNIFILNPPPSF